MTLSKFITSTFYFQDNGGGSLGSLEDLIPLVIPILEDISDVSIIILPHPSPSAKQSKKLIPTHL